MRLQEVHTAWREVLWGPFPGILAMREKKRNSVSKCRLSYCPVLKEERKKVTWQPRTALVFEEHFCIELRELKSTKSNFFIYIKRAHPRKEKKNGVMSRYFSQSLIIISLKRPYLLREKGLLNLYSLHKMCFSQQQSFQSHEVIFQMWNHMK